MVKNEISVEQASSLSQERGNIQSTLKLSQAQRSPIAVCLEMRIQPLVTSFIEPILIVTGLSTMGAIALFLLPQPGLKLLLGIETTEQGILLLARHWGLLLFLVGALLVYSAFVPAIRVPVLIVAITEKVVISAQLLFGMNPKTRFATFAAWFDAGCVVLYLLNIVEL